MSCQCCDKDKTIEELQDEVDDLKGELHASQRDLAATEDELENYKYVVLKLDALVRNRLRELNSDSSDRDYRLLINMLHEIESV